MNHKEFFRWLFTHPLSVLASVLLVCDIAIVVATLGAHRSTLRVSFLNVGQGDAVFVEAPNGNQLLYDAGPPSGASLRALAGVMPLFDRSIDVAVFSHPDMDHIGGFPEVFKRYEVGAVLEPGATSENGVYDAAEAAIVREHAAHILAHRGMQVNLGGGVVADVLYPDHDMAGSETNSASIVLRVRYGTTAFLLSGDLPQAQEEYVAKEFGDGLHAQVLKLGHHGSRTSSSPYFLAAVHPDIAIISAGKDNRYGHPHKEVVDLLAKLGIPSLKTFEEGTITLESNGETVTRY
jgi:competence protein ComEC